MEEICGPFESYALPSWNAVDVVRSIQIRSTDTAKRAANIEEERNRICSDKGTWCHEAAHGRMKFGESKDACSKIIYNDRKKENAEIAKP